MKRQPMQVAAHCCCLLCSGTELKHLLRKDAADLVQCRDCGFVFFRQIPDTGLLDRHYSGYGRSDYLSPVTVKRYHEILNRLEPFRQTNRLLDVGCGIGYFLDVARDRGWEVHGTEYTDRAIEICESKGIQMKKGALGDLRYEASPFDALTSFEVIEHIHTPREEVARFGELVRPGGAVYITTPNFNSLSRRLLGAKWTVISYPEHLGYFTPATLNRLMGSQGFTPLSVESTGISITRYKRAMKTSAQPLISAASDDERLRVRIEGSVALHLLKATLNGGLSLFGCGDALKGLYVNAGRA